MKLIFIPFKRENSYEQIVSTIGGLMSLAYVSKTDDAQKNLDKVKRNVAEIKELAPSVPGYQAALRDAEDTVIRWEKVLADARAADERANTPGWKTTKTSEVVCLDDEAYPGILRGYVNTDPTDTLYIRGHCAPGSNHLESSDHKHRIRVEEVVTKLVGALPWDFAGKIKIFACNSGTSKWHSHSFAFRFSKLTRKEFPFASVYGYDATVLTFVDKNGHKCTDSGGRASKALAIK